MNEQLIEYVVIYIFQVMVVAVICYKYVFPLTDSFFDFFRKKLKEKLGVQN